MVEPFEDVADGLLHQADARVRIASGEVLPTQALEVPKAHREPGDVACRGVAEQVEVVGDAPASGPARCAASSAIRARGNRRSGL